MICFKSYPNESFGFINILAYLFKLSSFFYDKFPYRKFISMDTYMQPRSIGPIIGLGRAAAKGPKSGKGFRCSGLCARAASASQGAVAHGWRQSEEVVLSCVGVVPCHKDGWA